MKKQKPDKTIQAIRSAEYHLREATKDLLKQMEYKNWYKAKDILAEILRGLEEV